MNLSLIARVKFVPMMKCDDNKQYSKIKAQRENTYQEQCKHGPLRNLELYIEKYYHNMSHRRREDFWQPSYIKKTTKKAFTYSDQNNLSLDQLFVCFLIFFCINYFSKHSIKVYVNSDSKVCSMFLIDSWHVVTQMYIVVQFKPVIGCCCKIGSES